jgi:hypothetical protein
MVIRKALSLLPLLVAITEPPTLAQLEKARSAALSLSETDHSTLAQLRVSGKKQTMVLVVTPVSKTAPVEASLRQHGYRWGKNLRVNEGLNKPRSSHREGDFEIYG